MQADMAEQTNEIFKIMYKNYMDKFRASLEKTLIMDEGNEEFTSLKQEVQTLRGAMEEDTKRKAEEYQRRALDEKDRELEELKQQIELIHQKMNTNNNPPPPKEKGLSQVMGIVKSLMEAKEVVFPILEGLGVQIPKPGGQAPTAPLQMPNMPNNVQGEVYRDIKTPQNINQTFTGFEDDDISFMGFDDNPSQNLFKDNISSNIKKESMEVDPMSYKNMANKVMVVILKAFKQTDVVTEVIPMVEKEIAGDFWTIIKESGFNENAVLGMGLKAPREFAKEVMKHIPKDLLELADKNPTGQSYSQIIEDTLTKVVNESAKKSLN
jgi:hypothetical protein